MKKVSLILILFLTFSYVVLAGNGGGKSRIISGKIIDAQSGEAIAGVQINVGKDNTYYTDMDGNFIIQLNQSGSSELILNMVGYKPLILKSSQVTSTNEILIYPR